MLRKVKSQETADFTHSTHFSNSSASRHHLFLFAQFLQERMMKISTFKIESRMLRRSINEDALKRDI